MASESHDRGEIVNSKALPLAASTLLILALSGCATSPEKITANYVSPTQYNSLSCTQMREKITRISKQFGGLAKAQKRKSRNDAIAVGTGLIFFPGVAFLSSNDKEQELAQLKGEYQALEQSASRKECGIFKESDTNN